MLKWVIFYISIGLLLGSHCMADSLWHASRPSIYNTVSMPRVGDIITVYISDSSFAVQEAGTNTSKESRLSANLYDVWDNYSQNAADNESNRKLMDYRLGGDDRYSGLGKTTRKTKIKAVVSAVVTQLLANGNLIIVGENQISVNDETEVIRVSGVIRPQDISPNNSVFSYQIAQIQISIKGDGVVGSKQTPGVLTKMFNWVF